MSPASAVPVDDVVFWMGVDTFYIYAGGTQQPCPVKDKVFLDFNFDERDKVHVGVNSCLVKSFGFIQRLEVQLSMLMLGETT